MGKLKQNVGWLLAAAGIVLLSLLAAWQNRYAGQWDGAQLAAEAGTMQENAYYTDTNWQTAGPSASVQLELTRGRYELAVQYQAEAEGSRVVVRAEDALNEDNTLGQTLLELPLPVGQTVARANFALPQGVSENLSVTLYYGGQGALWLHRLYVTGGVLGCLDYLWMGLLCLLLLGGVALLCRHARALPPPAARELLVTVFVLAAITVVCSLPLCMDLIPGWQDVQFHMKRIQGLADELAAGQFPVWVEGIWHGGAGMAVPTYYPSLLLYPAAFGRLLGLSQAECYRSLLLIVNICTVLFSYMAARRMTKSGPAALVCAAVYSLSSYRIMSLYARGALGEVLGMLFLPLVALGLYCVFLEDARGWPWLVAGYVGVLNAHLITLELAGIFSVVFGLFYLRRLAQKGRLWALLRALGLTVLLGLWQLVPIASGFGYNFMKKDELTGMTLHRTTLYFSQMFVAFGKLDGVSNDLPLLADEMPLGLGPVALWVLLAAAAWCLWARVFPATGRGRRVALGLAASAALLYSVSVYFPWGLVERLPLMGTLARNLQFAWRILAFASLAVALLAALLVAALPQNRRWLALGLVAALCVAGAQYQLDGLTEGASYYSRTAEETIVDAYDYLLLDWDTDAVRAMDDTLQPGEGVQLAGVRQQGTRTQFSFSKAAGAAGTVALHRFAYPGYRAVLADGTDLPLGQTAEGLLTVTLPAEAAEGSVRVYFAGFWYWRLAQAVSLGTALGWLGLWLARRKPKRTREEKA